MPAHWYLFAPSKISGTAMSFQKLDDLGHKLEALEHALAILGADEATHMAVGGGEKRAEAMSALAGMHHARATAPTGSRPPNRKR
jgi:carboxypeptidase Taq